MKRRDIINALHEAHKAANPTPSVLEPIRDYILNQCTDLEDGKRVVLDTLSKAPIQDTDIKRMKVQVMYQIRSLPQLQRFVSNMILAKQGLKV